MELLKRTLRVLAVFVLANLGLLELLCPLPGTVHWLLLLGLSAFYVWFHICPRRAKGAPRRLRAMIGGYELLLVSFLTLAAETVFYIVLLCTGMPLVPAPYSAPRWVALVANLLVFLPLVGACGVHIKASAGGVARAAAVFVVAALFQHLFIFPCAENRAQGILFRACTAGGRGGPY